MFKQSKSPDRFRFILRLLVFILVNILTARNLFSQSGTEYLTAAKKTAAWLSSVSTEKHNGLCWPYSDINSYASPERCNGAAGIGLFFIKLYNNTGNASYLDIAEKSAEYVYYEHRYIYMHGPDWFTGAASGGDYLLTLFKETGKNEYLDKAEYFAGWLMDNKYTENDGYFWKHSADFPKIYTSIAHGAAGIGLFFLNLHEEKNDQRYLDHAEKAFLWLTNHIVRFDEKSIGWKRITKDDFAYHLWCGGSTGIIFFLKKLYEITGKDIYKNYLRETVNGLIKHAVYSDDGCSWYYTSDSYPSGHFSTVYCHGTSSTAHALYSANTVLNDDNCLRCARAGAKWLENQKKYKSSDSIYWTYFTGMNWVNTGLLTGVASSGYSFLKYYEFDPDSKYIDLATKTANWLLETADKPAENQMRWVNHISIPDEYSEEKQYYTGWYKGAAGIGIFLLELYDVLNQKDTTNLEDKIPVEFCTLKNYPNPFNTTTKLEFEIPKSTYVTLEIYGVSGKKLKTLLKNSYFYSGKYYFTWNGQDDFGKICPSGVYIARLRTESTGVSKKIVLIK